MLIKENSEYFKKKKEESVISLNEKKYREQQEEVNEKSKKIEELQKKAVLLEIANTPADEAKLADNAKKFSDTTAISKNKEWLKNVSKDIYISEAVNVLNDLKKSGVTLNMDSEK